MTEELLMRTRKLDTYFADDQDNSDDVEDDYSEDSNADTGAT